MTKNDERLIKDVKIVVVVLVFWCPCQWQPLYVVDTDNMTFFFTVNLIKSSQKNGQISHPVKDMSSIFIVAVIISPNEYSVLEQNAVTSFWSSQFTLVINVVTEQ